MNEGDVVAALTDIGETFSTFTGLWVSVTFAYLTVAYLVGAALNRFQCLAISTLYVVSAVIFGTSAQGYAEAWVKLHTREDSVFDEVFVFSNISFYGEAAAIFFVFGTALSLYFMYDVRNRRGRVTGPGDR